LDDLLPGFSAGYQGIVPKQPQGSAYRFVYTPGGKLAPATLSVPVLFDTIPVIAPVSGAMLSLHQPLVIQLGLLPKASVNVLLEDADQNSFDLGWYAAAPSITISTVRLASATMPTPVPAPTGQPTPATHQFVPGMGSLNLTVSVDLHPQSAFHSAETVYNDQHFSAVDHLGGGRVLAKRARSAGGSTRACDHEASLRRLGRR